MAVSQSLTVKEVIGSVNNSANTSKVRIEWTSTQSGGSYNDYKRTAKYWISINGGDETEYTASYRLPQNDTRVIVDTTITVPHKDDGTGTVRVRTRMDTGISAGVIEKSAETTLTTIPRASTIISATDTVLGDYCAVTWIPLSQTFRYKLKFYLDDLVVESGIIYPESTEIYTHQVLLPLEWASQITDGPQRRVAVALFTYSDGEATAQVGNSYSATFNVVVPDNADTKPVVEMTLEPVGSLSSDFNGLYVQGKSQVKASFSSIGKLGASITSNSMAVQDKNYSYSPYTSDVLTQYGNVTVKGTATDSRGFVGTESETIYVIPYSAPKINVSVCERCDGEGNLNASGTYLKIKAKRTYSKAEDANGVPHNTCIIRYRYAVQGGSFGDWDTILESHAISDDIEAILLHGTLDVRYAYTIQIGVIDTVGEYSNTVYAVPPESVFMHRRAGGKGLGLGRYCEEDDLLDIDWNARVRGELRLLDRGDPVVDFVTKTGTDDNGWNYIKRSSGLIEAWYQKRIDVISLTQEAESGVYITKPYDAEKIKLPSVLVGGTIYHTSANIESDGYTLCQVSNHNESTLTYRIWSSYLSTLINAVIMIYCVGRNNQQEEIK